MLNWRLFQIKSYSNRPVIATDDLRYPRRRGWTNLF